jgi:hypothetical protein
VENVNIELVDVDGKQVTTNEAVVTGQKSATLEWDQATETATISKDGIVVKVTAGASKITVTKSGATSEIEIDAPAKNINGRIYLPARFVLEAFNYTVAYDQATNSIICTL